jgi:hypothetical protein
MDSPESLEARLMKRWRLDALPPALADAFRRYHRRVRLFQTLQAVMVLALFYLLLAWAALHVDRFGSLTQEQRVFMSAGIHGLIAVPALIWLAFIHLRPLPVKRIAYSLEARLGPSAEERYTTLADMLNQGLDARRPDERRLIAELQEEALRTSAPHGAAGLIRDRSLPVWAAICGFALALFFLPLASPRYEYARMLARFYNPRGPTPRPSFVKLDVQPSAGAIGQGRQFVLQVKTSGAVPRAWVWILKQLGRPLAERPVVDLEEAAGSGRRVRRDMTRLREGQYLITESKRDTTFRFQVACQDAVSAWREIEVIPVPVVSRVMVSVTPPAYSKLEPVEFEHTGQGVPLLKESRVRVSFQVNQPVRDVEILSDLSETPLRPEWDEKTGTGTYSLLFRDPMTLTIRVRNERGFENSRPPVLPFRLLEDQPPAVRIQARDVAADCAATDAVSIPFQAEDDFGIARVALNVIVNPLPDQRDGGKELPVPDRGGGKTLDDVAQLDVSLLDVDPGDRLLVRVMVRDSVGQNTLSPGVLIAISAFGRGTREEARLRALRFLETAIERAGESTSRGAGPADLAMAINEGTYKRLLADAAKQGVTLSKASRFSSLLEVIEREHFLTEDPWDKEDLRRMHGIAAMAAGSLAGGADPVARRNDILFELHDRTLVPLTDYRELRNLMWRLFGLRDAVIEAAALPDGTMRPARIRLIMDTLDTCLARLLILSRRDSGLDAGALAAVIQEVNTARTLLVGRQDYDYNADIPFGLNKPEAKDEGAAPETIRKVLMQVRGSLAKLLAVAQAAVPGAVERRAKVSEQLRGRHRDMLRQMVEAASGADETGWARRGALDWLETDMRLVRGNPLFQAGPFAVNDAATELLLQAGGKTDAGAAAGALAAADSPVFARHARALDAFNACSEIRLLAGLRNVTEAERNVAARLVQLELVTRDPAQAGALARLGDELKRMALGESPAAPAAALADPESVCAAAGAHLETEAALAAEFEKREGAKPLKEQAERVRAVFRETQARWGEPEKAKDGLDRERHVLRHFTDRLQAVLGRLPASGGNPDVLASFCLKLRDFRDRPAASIRLLTDAPGEGRLTRGQVDDGDLDKALVKRHRDAVVLRLELMLDTWGRGDVQELTDYQKVLLEQIRETAFFAEIGARLAGGVEPADGARQFIGGSEEAAMAYLDASLPRLADIVGQADGARRLLIRNNAMDAAARVAFAKAGSDLERYARDMEAVRESEFRKYLVGELGRIGADIVKFSEGTPEVNAVIYQAGLLIDKLRDLSRETAAYSARLGSLRFTGGALELDGVGVVRADEAGRHLAERVQEERRALCQAVFSALGPEPSPGLGRMALPHAAFLHRLVRGDLVRYRPVVPIVPAGEEKGDYAAFLRQELEKASKIKIQQYSRTVQLYLGRMGGYTWEIPGP